MIFSDSPQQRALERMMTAVPRFRPKGGGIMVLHHFEYTAEIPYLQVYTLRDKEYSFSSGITPSVFCSFCGKTVDVFALFVMALLLCFV